MQWSIPDENAQCKIFFISFLFQKLMHPPSSSVRLLQAKVSTHQQICALVIITRVHHVPFTSLTISRQKTGGTFVARSLDRYVGLKVVWNVWGYMPRQMLVCCVVSVRAPKQPRLRRKNTTSKKRWEQISKWRSEQCPNGVKYACAMWTSRYSRHIKGLYPAATLQLLCGYVVSEEFVVSSLENLNLGKFCFIKCTVCFTMHNDKLGKKISFLTSAFQSQNSAMFN
jgi:hypothetical protein